jgi:uncharacterized protein (DUF1501 family)
MDRRVFLRGLGMLGCSAAAHPFMTTVTLAGSDGSKLLGDHRLVVVILRGAMDGLDVVQPYGAPELAGLRPTIYTGEGTDLDGFFRLHPGLGDLKPMWDAGGLGFVHATATPYRDKRSHFEGQDLLEAGSGTDVAASEVKGGWLNRLLLTQSGLTSETAYAIGREAMPLLEGAADVREWSPETKLMLTAQSKLLLEQIYHDDPLFQMAAAEAMELAARGDPSEAMMLEDGLKPNEIERLVDYAAGRLREDTRIAAFSLSGWDTHRGQKGPLTRSLSQLQQVILRLQTRLGAEVWGKTVLLAMTEFGRTARENGNQGTDHGTGGAMLMAGGALRGGKVYGDWPGLAEADLFERRDLMPTSDVRQWAAHVMQGLYGLDRGMLENVVFPGLQMGPDPKVLL